MLYYSLQKQVNLHDVFHLVSASAIPRERCSHLLITMQQPPGAPPYPSHARVPISDSSGLFLSGIICQWRRAADGHVFLSLLVNGALCLLQLQLQICEISSILVIKACFPGPASPCVCSYLYASSVSEWENQHTPPCPMTDTHTLLQILSDSMSSSNKGFPKVGIIPEMIVCT